MESSLEQSIQELQTALGSSTIFTISPHYERWEDGFKSLDNVRKKIGELKVKFERAPGTPRWLMSDLTQVHSQLESFVRLRDDFYRQFPNGGDSHNWSSLRSAERSLDELQRTVSSLKDRIRTGSFSEKNDGLSKKSQQVLAFAFGITFLITILGLAIFIVNPSPFQYFTFRVVLSLAAAGVAAMIPGFLHMSIAGWLRTGGAIAVFVIVFFENPADLVVSAPSTPDATAPSE